MKFPRLAMSFAALALLGGCSWVEVQPQAGDIVVLSQERVADCKYLGKVDVSVLSRVMGMDRLDSDVENDLENLARNNALDMGGDTVSPLSKARNGKQTFGIYKCLSGDSAGQPANREGTGGATTHPYGGGGG
ncbi:MAG: DUF4156 domain-containing protein [Gammaproteobacteria bacterium]|jgi:hypothetical protein